MSMTMDGAAIPRHGRTYIVPAERLQMNVSLFKSQNRLRCTIHGLCKSGGW